MAARHASADMGGGLNHGLSHFLPPGVGHDDDATRAIADRRAATDRRTPPALRQVSADLEQIDAELRRHAGEFGHLAAAYQLLHRQYDAISIAHAALREECRILQLTVRQRDDVVAEMHQRLEEARHQVDLLKARRPAPSRHVYMCGVCCDDFPPWRLLWCRNDEEDGGPHAACVDCVERVLKAVNANPCLSYTRQIGCLSSSADCPSALAGLSATREGLRYLRNEALAGAADHVCNLVRCATVGGTVDMDRLALQIHMLNADGSFRGLACARCGWGPMWNDACSDLVSHHDQEDEDGARIDNRCPSCHALVHDTREMVPWDGDMLSV